MLIRRVMRNSTTSHHRGYTVSTSDESNTRRCRARDLKRKRRVVEERTLRTARPALGLVRRKSNCTSIDLFFGPIFFFLLSIPTNGIRASSFRFSAMGNLLIIIFTRWRSASVVSLFRGCDQEERDQDLHHTHGVSFRNEIRV